jgi:hypothetical protein
MRISSVALRRWGLALLSASILAGQTAAPANQGQIPPDPGWPREYSDGKAKLVLYQPQVDSWKDYQHLKGRIAIALTPAKGSPAVYGTVTVETDTKLDMATRTVSYANFQVQGIRFPNAPSEAEAQKLIVLATTLLPDTPTSVALDRILAYLDLQEAPAKVREVQVSMDPPPILVSNQPAALVIIDGKPILNDIEQTRLQKVLNTNWDLFFHKEEGKYYLLDDQTWLSAKSLQDAWSPVSKLPADFKSLPATEEYADVRKAVASPQQPKTAKLILMADKPSELILIAGEPLYTPVPGTNLMWVNNCESDLFLDNAAKNFYFLTSGRWFRTADLKSRKWEAATTSLPADFKKIPENHPRAHILAAVPGTKQAEAAVLAASIPQKAEINRATAAANAKVDYVGDPKFEPIAGTNVSYAVNTPNDVVKLGESYYLCLDGVWFVGTNPKGPWQLADKIPEEIYSIPPSSPKHNVTYVQVYETTPETVTYGYTSGYSNVCISFGVAMWGTGYYYPYYYGYGMYPYPVYWGYPYYTYGAAAWYNPATGAYGRGSAVYGPYGGYARGAAYNPSTGRYAWGQRAYGPYGAAASGGFYNPSTGGWGGSYRATNGYQSWGQSVVGRGDQWARGAHYSDSRGTVGGIQTSRGGSAIAARGSDGQGAMIGRSGSGDFYAGKDGNVYRRDSNGNWYQNSGSGSWNPVERPSRSGTAGTTERAGGKESVQGLNRDAANRQWGNSSAQRSQSLQNRGASAGASSRGGGNFSGSRSGMGYSRGFGGGGRRR